MLTTNKKIIPQYEVHEETLQVLKHYPYQQVVHQRDEPKAIFVLVVVQGPLLVYMEERQEGILDQSPQ